MDKLIYLERNEIEKLANDKKCAIISFDSDFILQGVLIKKFSKEEGSKGFEQLKRWLSVSSFEVIVLSGFEKALPYIDKAHILEWIEDHSKEWGFPFLVLEGGVTDKDLLKLFKKG